MVKQSAGMLVFRRTGRSAQVLLAHPGGPFWGKKDVWSIPKGELEPEEDRQSAALREFEEEVGFAPPKGELIDLGESKQSGKINFIWAVEGDDVDIKRFKSNTFSMEWPPHSGQDQEFPENDRAAWFELSEARVKLFKAQTCFIDRLAEQLGVSVDARLEPEQQSLL